jgi:hypothetical protein
MRHSKKKIKKRETIRKNEKIRKHEKNKFSVGPIFLDIRKKEKK